jgi:hypothetical protein
MNTILAIGLPAIALVVAFVTSLRIGRTRLILKTIFRWPTETSTLIKVNGRWLETTDPAHTSHGDIPAERAHSPRYEQSRIH